VKEEFFHDAVPAYFLLIKNWQTIHKVAKSFVQLFKSGQESQQSDTNPGHN
jgi:hypothetical protein